MAFDGIVTKAIASELNLLSGARIDKIFQPNNNNVILGFYLNGSNYVLNICTNSQNYRVHLTTHLRSNPKVAPNFCMVLRKHLIGLRIKNIITSHLERIITIEFEGFDDIDDLISKKLIIELMGKHCNVILLNDDGTIIDSLRHIRSEDSTHIVVPHIRYTYPEVKKLNFLDCNSFQDFEEKLTSSNNPDNTNNSNNSNPSNYSSFPNLEKLGSNISNTFNGISKGLIHFIIEDLNITKLSDIYNYLETLISGTDSLNLKFVKSTNLNKKEDYFLVPSENIESFSLNFFLDDFYYEKETSEELKTSRNTILKLILSTLKKYKKRLENINSKLKECDNMDIYKLYGELITANLYRIPNKNLKEIELENYYDNNKMIIIPLDSKYLPSANAKRFFKKYNKLKNALEIVSAQKDETIKELDYLESIVYELESATSLEELSVIFEEISENVIFKDKIKSTQKSKTGKIKKSNLTKNKNVNFNPLKFTIDGFTLLVGRNNKENDYLTLKYANKQDLWFHTKDIHGSHAILLLNNITPSQDILAKCAEITAYHSKARLSSNVPVDVCEVRYVKKPNGAKPGMVIYTNYHTLYVNPLQHI